MFIIRQIATSDLDSILELARYLDSMNLPHDRSALQALISDSVASFQDPSRARDRCTYMLVLEDFYQKKVVGTSLIFAKHGTKEIPHTYLKVLKKTHEDSELNISKEHTLLRFEYDTDGPSEIGGLILHPDYRGLPLSLGKFLSYARFMYIGMNLSRFEKNVIAELLPPFLEEGSNELWEAFGRRFTNLSYKEADRFSRTTRNFIQTLFPQEDIYTCLFNDKAQSVIGKTGPSASSVKHMLERIGFSYLNAVDPFDGGPHYGAKTKEITLIKRLKKGHLSEHRLRSQGNSGLIGFQSDLGFTCLMGHQTWEGSHLEVSEEANKILTKVGFDLGDPLCVISPL